MEGRYIVIDAMHNFICREVYEAVALKMAQEIGGDVIDAEDLE